MRGTGHYSILFLGLVMLISLLSSAQVRERFPNEDPFFSDTFPLIPGYSTNTSDTAFHQGVDDFLLDQFKRAFRLLGYSIDGSCQVLLTFEGDQILEVQIIETNSDIYARMVEGFLFNLPLQNSIQGELKISHEVGRMAGCCRRGIVDLQPLDSSASANIIIAQIALEHQKNRRDSLRWLIQSNGTKPICLALNPSAEPSWNDLVLSHLDTIYKGLPQHSGMWIVGYYPDLSIAAFHRLWRESLRSDENQGLGWRRSLNQWLTYYDCKEFHPDRPTNDSISLSELSLEEISSSIAPNQRIVLVVEPNLQEVLSILTIEDHEVTSRAVSQEKITHRKLKTDNHPDAPLLVEVLP